MPNCPVKLAMHEIVHNVLIDAIHISRPGHYTVESGYFYPFYLHPQMTIVGFVSCWLVSNKVQYESDDVLIEQLL